jgi:hypothetical protein
MSVGKAPLLAAQIERVHHGLGIEHVPVRLQLEGLVRVGAAEVSQAMSMAHFMGYDRLYVCIRVPAACDGAVRVVT